MIKVIKKGEHVVMAMDIHTAQAIWERANMNDTLFHEHVNIGNSDRISRHNDDIYDVFSTLENVLIRGDRTASRWWPEEEK